MIKVLIVEDDSFLAQMYANKFQFSDYQVFVAADGDKALPAVKKNSPDIILLDLMLPKKDGFTVLSELKHDVATKDIPVLILSNLSQKSDVDRCLALGASDYLIKAHCIPSEVVDKVGQILEKNAK